MGLFSQMRYRQMCHCLVALLCDMLSSSRSPHRLPCSGQLSPCPLLLVRAPVPSQAQWDSCSRGLHPWDEGCW